MVPRGGFEPPRACARVALNHVRLPFRHLGIVDFGFWISVLWLGVYILANPIWQTKGLPHGTGKAESVGQGSAGPSAHQPTYLLYFVIVHSVTFLNRSLGSDIGTALKPCTLLFRA